MSSEPIVVGTPMKSGTWLIRRILTELTGQPCREPPMVKPMDAGDPRHVLLFDDAVYSWHFVPTRPVRDKLVNGNAKVIFVLRNVYAMALSAYHHFADNIDWEIGRGADKQELFARLGFDLGMQRIIAPDAEGAMDGFNWDGMGRHYAQMQQMLEFCEEYSCLLLTYEQLVLDKSRAVNQVAEYLGIEASVDAVGRITERTDFGRMKQEESLAGRGSHLRRGSIDEYLLEFSDEHRALVESQVEVHAPELARRAVDFGVGYLLEWRMTVETEA